MRIAIVTPYAFPEKGACPVRVNSFKSYFQKYGHVTTVFAPVRANIKKGTAGVIRYKNLRELLSLIYRSDFDVVIGVSTSLMYVFFVLLICKIKKVPFILDTKEPFTHTAAALRIYPPHALKFRVYKHIEKFIHKYADRIFVLTPLDKEWVTKYFNVDTDKVIVIMNGVESNTIRRDNEEGRKIREHFAIPLNAPVLAYIGGLGDEEVELFLKSAEDLVKRCKGHFLLVISCDETPHEIELYNKLESVVKTLGIEKNFHAIKNVEYPEMYKYLSAADVGVVPWPNALIFSLPVKIFEYMACELPIVVKGPEEGSMYEFFKKYDVGFYSTNWSQFKEALSMALNNLKNFKRKGIEGRNITIKEFTREKSNEMAFEQIKSL